MKSVAALSIALVLAGCATSPGIECESRVIQIAPGHAEELRACVITDANGQTHVTTSWHEVSP
jgi:hypothetical protein